MIVYIVALIVAITVVWSMKYETPKYQVGDCFGFDGGSVIAMVQDRKQGRYVLDLDVTGMESRRDYSYGTYKVIDETTMKMPCPPRRWRKS